MVERWDIITIGNISRNRYWGEGDDKPRRSAICTCTLVRGDGLCLLVDPSLADEEKMAAELDRRSGLKLSDIAQVFITHGHGDHHYGLKHFPAARWMAGPGVAEAINRGGQYSKAVEAVSGQVTGGVEAMATPGHTPDHHSLRFECEGQVVIITGDAAMTRDFWRDRRGYFNSIDPAVASATIQKLSALADIVVPGHDNWFTNRR